MLIPKPRFPIKQILSIGLLPSRLKVAYYRNRGAKIGDGVEIGLGSVLVGEEIEIGDFTTIGFGTIIRGRSITIGQHVRIGSTTIIDTEKIVIDDDAKINEQVFVGGLTFPDSYFHLGKRTILMQHTFLNPAKPLIIGDDTGIGGKCTIFTHGSWQSMLEGYPVRFAPVTIGSNVWIPWEVFIMPGVTIGDGATIGAGSLVAQNIPAGCLAVGSPAKVIKTAEEYPKRPSFEQRQHMLKEIFQEFVTLMKHYGLQSNHNLDTLVFSQFCEICLFFPVKQTDKSWVIGRFSATDIPSHFLRPQSVIISLETLNSQERQVISTCHSMWLDLKTYQRGGVSTPIGEELVDFIARYGIRFERIK